MSGRQKEEGQLVSLCGQECNVKLEPQRYAKKEVPSHTNATELAIPAGLAMVGLSYVTD